jgi:hypothetical protein
MNSDWESWPAVQLHLTDTRVATYCDFTVLCQLLAALLVSQCIAGVRHSSTASGSCAIKRRQELC